MGDVGKIPTTTTTTTTTTKFMHTVKEKHSCPSTRDGQRKNSCKLKMPPLPTPITFLLLNVSNLTKTRRLPILICQKKPKGVTTQTKALKCVLVVTLLTVEESSLPCEQNLLTLPSPPPLRSAS